MGSVWGGNTAPPRCKGAKGNESMGLETGGMGLETTSMGLGCGTVLKAWLAAGLGPTAAPGEFEGVPAG